MKKFLAFLLILSFLLLTGCGSDSASSLWADARQALDRCSCSEQEYSTRVIILYEGQKTSEHSWTSVLTKNSDAYSLVTTGSSEAQLCRVSDTLYYTSDCGSFSSPYSDSALSSFLTEYFPDVRPETVGSVKLGSGNSEVTFSKPSEELTGWYEGFLSRQGLTLKSIKDFGGTASVSNGLLSGITMTAECSASVGTREGYTVLIESGFRLNSRDENACTPSVPEDSVTFTECDDVSLVLTLKKAFELAGSSHAADYTVAGEYSLNVFGVPISASTRDHIRFSADLLTPDITFRENYSADLQSSADAYFYSYEADYADGSFVLTYGDGSTEQGEVGAADLISTVFSAFLEPLNASELSYYTSIAGTSEKITFEVDGYTLLSMLDTVMTLLDSDASGGVYDSTGVRMEKNDCSVELDKETGAIRSMVCACTFTVYFSDGEDETVTCDLTLTRSYDAFNSAVTLK